MTRAAKTALLLGVLVLGLSRVAAAQRSLDSVGADPEPRVLPPVTEPVRPSLPVRETVAARPLVAIDAAWLQARRPAREAERAKWVLAGIQLWNTRIAGRDTGALRGVRRLNRKLLPIPLLRWQGYSPIGPRGLIALNPSLVIGRRQTFMSTIFRGGRTFGFAVEMKIRFDRVSGPAAAPVGAATRDPGSIILSTVRGFLDRNR